MKGITIDSWRASSAAVLIATAVVIAASPAQAHTATGNPASDAVTEGGPANVEQLAEHSVLDQLGLNQEPGPGQAGSISALVPSPKPDAATAAGILGVHATLGNVAAPIRSFRDGGHAYYLFGKGLHSCTYTGRCMDLFAAPGEPLYALADGVVSVPPYASHSYGNYVVIRHRDGTTSIYAHLGEVNVKRGPVTAGTLIGTVGCSGTSGESNGCAQSAAHLHFEWSGLKWAEGEYGELPPFFKQWRGDPHRCYQGC